jgi:hypothetical protein
MLDIWENKICLSLLQDGQTPNGVYEEKMTKDKKRIHNYSWHANQLLFKGSLVPKLEDKKEIIMELHQEIGHFGENKTFVKVHVRGFIGTIELSR